MLDLRDGLMSVLSEDLWDVCITMLLTASICLKALQIQLGNSGLPEINCESKQNKNQDSVSPSVLMDSNNNKCEPSWMLQQMCVLI